MAPIHIVSLTRADHPSSGPRIIVAWRQPTRDPSAVHAPFVHALYGPLPLILFVFSPDRCTGMLECVT